jgi:hypothetical protein
MSEDQRHIKKEKGGLKVVMTAGQHRVGVVQKKGARRAPCVGEQ